MKRLFITLSIVLILISCNNEPKETSKPNPFVGTWEVELKGHSILTLVFTKTELTTTRRYLSSSGQIDEQKGTYTYDDDNIYFTITETTIEALTLPFKTTWPYNFIDENTLHAYDATYTRKQE